MPPVVAIIRSAINSALILLLENTKREENEIMMVKRPTNIAFTKEVKVFERYMLLKSNSALVKLDTIMVTVTAQIINDKRREAKKKLGFFLPKKTSAIKINKAPQKSVISGEINERLIMIKYFF
jgi:hypothetical protein